MKNKSQAYGHQGFDTSSSTSSRNYTDETKDVATSFKPKVSIWERLRKKRGAKKKDPSTPSSPRSVRLVRNSSSTDASSDNENEHLHTCHSNYTRNPNAPRSFGVICPVGLEPGNRVDIRSPSGIMPVFSARVPTGKLGGDLFVVRAPTEEKLIQAEYEDAISAMICGVSTPRCGVNDFDEPAVPQSSPPTDHSSWKIFSRTLDDWLTPTPEVTGRPVEKKRSSWV